MEILYYMIDIAYRMVLYDIVQSDDLTVLVIRKSLALHIDIHTVLTTEQWCELKRSANVTGFAYHFSRLSLK